MRFSCPRHLLRALVAGVALAMLAGCAQMRAPAAHTEPEQPTAARAPAPGQDVIALLRYAADLRAATPEQRAATVAAARDRVGNAPGPQTYARLALAYGTPHQVRYTPDEAARYAQLALDANAADWSTPATQYLTDYVRLYAKISGDTHNDRTADAQATPASDKQRIAELEAELADARRKLREVADIEDNLSTDSP